MSILDILLLAVGLAMDCFAVSIVSGVLQGGDALATAMRALPRTMLRMAVLFGLFQALMPLIGWLGISLFQKYMEAYDHWIAFLLLAFIGGRMVKDGLSPSDEPHFDPSRLRVQLLLAVATSIDALAVGVSFSCTGYTALSQLAFPLTAIGLVSVLFSIAGYLLGRRYGHAIARRLKPELAGGIILIFIGTKILLSHLTGVS